LSPGREVRILLAEDVRMVREALVAHLDQQDGLVVVGHVSRGDDILGQAVRLKPDVAVVDLDLPGVSGLGAAAQLRDHLPECRVLIVTGVTRPRVLLRCLEEGASGVLLKSSSTASLVQGVHDVAAGRRAIDPQLALAAVDTMAPCPLSQREIDVLELTAEGASVKEIASDLFLSVGTVRNNLTSIVTKLGARTKVDAVRVAVSEGWIDGPVGSLPVEQSRSWWGLCPRDFSGRGRASR
jgi:two-component system response regulator DesR